MSSTHSHPKVSVCVIAYNQEDYIQECLISILEQKTNFTFDIVVGEDCSTDSTSSIIEDLSNAHKNILLLENSTNLGVLPNFIRTLKACKGEYIAFCEGDDYWIDAYKLQKQVDFLDQNSQYGGVCGEIVSRNVEAKTEKKHPFKKQGEIVFEDLIQQNRIHSNTILFKRELIELDALQSIKDLSIGDWYLHLLVAKQKPYYYLPEYFALYREHSDGVFSKKTHFFKSYQKSKMLNAYLENEANEEDLTVIKNALGKHIYNSLRLSTKENKKELKELFAISLKHKMYRVNRSTIKGLINLIK